MNTHDEQWWELEAGEYVIGTLDHLESNLFDNIRKYDPDFQHLVTQWQRRLAPLDQTAIAVQPSEQVWLQIQRSLETEPAQSRANAIFDEAELDQTAAIVDAPQALHHGGALPGLQNPDSQTVFNLRADLQEGWQEGQQDELQNGLQEDSQNRTASDTTMNTEDSRPARPDSSNRVSHLWRDLTLLATAACIILLFITWHATQQSHRQAATPAATPHFDLISLITDQHDSALWLINASAQHSLITAAAITPPDPVENMSYWLWMVRASETIPLGLLPARQGEVLTLATSTGPDEPIEFQVTLEKPNPDRSEPTSSMKQSGAVLFRGTGVRLSPAHSPG